MTLRLSCLRCGRLSEKIGWHDLTCVDCTIDTVSTHIVGESALDEEHRDNHEAQCQTCEAKWCEACDPGAGSCHFCRGRGFSTAWVAFPRDSKISASRTQAVQLFGF
jgi:hypothetical protein